MTTLCDPTMGCPVVERVLRQVRAHHPPVPQLDVQLIDVNVRRGWRGHTIVDVGDISAAKSSSINTQPQRPPTPKK